MSSPGCKRQVSKAFVNSAREGPQLCSGGPRSLLEHFKVNEHVLVIISHCYAEPSVFNISRAGIIEQTAPDMAAALFTLRMKLSTCLWSGAPVCESSMRFKMFS